MIYANVFNEYTPPTTNIDRIRSFIKEEDVIIFLDFIHLRNNKPESVSLSQLFQEYLDYERKSQTATNEKYKAKTNYFQKLNDRIKNNKLSNSTLLIANHLGSQADSTLNIKKNLVIIEILENFVAEEETDDSTVDIEKLKLLLPRGMEINDDYFKRLIYTNISSINKAVDKLRSSKNKVIQYQLINKITNMTIKIDKDMDYEINKNLTIRKTEKRASNDNINQNDQLFINMLNTLGDIHDSNILKLREREITLLRRKIDEKSIKKKSLVGNESKVSSSN